MVDARLDLHTDMVRRWKTELPEPLKRFYFISTICDPRQKALRFPGVSASERGVALEWFEAEYDSLWAPAPTPITALAPATAIAPVSSHPQHQGASFMAFMAGLVHLQSDQAVPTADLSQSEAHKYLELSPMPMDTDILAWWATNEKIFPNLSVMARQYRPSGSLALRAECMVIWVRLWMTQCLRSGCGHASIVSIGCSSLLTSYYSRVKQCELV